MRIDEIFTPIYEMKATMPRRSIAAGEVMVDVDVEKFDRMWKHWEPSYYVGPGGTGAAIKGRYGRFSDWAKKSPTYEVPEVSVLPNGNLGFTNGRHRYAYLRDNGARVMPMAMSRKSVKNAHKHGLLVKRQPIEEGVPDPKKLVAALRRYVELVSTQGNKAARLAIQDMGLTPQQIMQVQSAYRKIPRKIR